VTELPTQYGALARDRKSFEVVGGIGGDEHVILEAKLSGETEDKI
jgi:hypothetical protein